MLQFMRYFYICAVCFFASLSIQAQYLQSSTLLQSMDSAGIVNYLNSNNIPTLFVPVSNGLDIYKITYNTVSYDSTPTVATGTVFVPTGAICSGPLLVYNHGTILKKSDAPSNQTGEYIVGVAFSADGITVAMPDYLGLGDSPGMHPYIHAQSEATCVIDMVRATRELFTQIDHTVNPQLFLSGYSQGGHTTMAAHKMMQEMFPAEFPVTVSAPCSGPYDVSGVQANVITKDSSYGSPGYLPFVLFSYNMVYNLYPNWNQVLKSPYDTLLPPLMDGSVGLGTIEALIPDTPNKILLPSLLADFDTNMNHPFRLVLRDNDLYRWAPQAPVRMFYCEADELVSYKNALVAKDSLLAYGATDVVTYSSGPNLGHADCALYALIGVKTEFELFRNDRPSGQVTILNPASGTTANDGSATAGLTSGYGPFTFVWSNGTTDSVATGLGYGAHSVTVTDFYGCKKTLNFQMGTVGLDNSWASGIQVYPNPASEHIWIQNQTLYPLSLRIWNSLGEMVYQSPASDSPVLYVPSANWSQGLYMLEIESPVGRDSRKLVVN